MALKRIGKIAGIVLVLGGISIGGLFAVGVLGVPDGGLEDNRWGEVDNESIEVHTDIYVDNPNPFGVGGDIDAEYDIYLQGTQMASGEEENLGIESGENEINLTTDLLHQNLPAWWVAHLNNDEVSELTVDATVHGSVGPFSGSPSMNHTDEIETDLEGALDEGFSSFEGTYSGTETDFRVGGTAIEPTVDVEDVTTQWGDVTENVTEIQATMTIHNPNAYPIPTPAFAGNLTFNDITMANWTADEVEVLEVQDDGLIPPGETEERTFVVGMDTQQIPHWFGSHVEQDEFTTMEVTGQFAMEVGGSELTIPENDEAITCTFDVTTSIFVDQDDGVSDQGCDVNPFEISDVSLDETNATHDPDDEETEDENGLLSDGESDDADETDGDSTDSDEEKETDEDDEEEDEESDDDDGLLSDIGIPVAG